MASRTNAEAENGQFLEEFNQFLTFHHFSNGSPAIFSFLVGFQRKWGVLLNALRLWGVMSPRERMRQLAAHASSAGELLRRVLEPHLGVEEAHAGDHGLGQA